MLKLPYLWALAAMVLGILVGTGPLLFPSSQAGQLTFTSASDLPSASGRLSGHWLLLPEQCNASVYEAAQAQLHPRRIARATGELARELRLAGGSCGTAACLGHGMELGFLSAGARRPEAAETSDLASWAEGACQFMHAGFVILSTEPVQLRWLDGPTGRPHAVTKDAWRHDTILRPHREMDTVMARQQEYWFIARLGDRFELRTTPADDGEVLKAGTVDFDGVHILGSLLPDDPTQRVSYVRDYWALLNKTASAERNRAQTVKKAYTATGSQVTDVPPAVWASVSSYYFNNAHASMPEGWLAWAEHVNVNFWESRPQIIAVPPRVKAAWQAGLMAGVSAWAGGIELEPTALYGMRVYKEGSFLSPHVDREETHALSLVLNVAQGGVRVPWPLEVDDMAGTVHDAILAPGQLVYYESARCLHGRTKLFQGEYFVNFFAHYRPKGDPDWYRDLHTGEPKPFKLVNDGMEEVTVSWVGPDGHLVLIDTVPAGEARDMGTKIGDEFRLAGACQHEFRVDALTGGAERMLRVCHGQGTKKVETAKAEATKAGTTKAGITVTNKADLVAELLWLGPGDSEPTLIDKIKPHTSINVNAKLNDRFLVRGACDESLLVASPDEVFTVCLSVISSGAFRKQIDSTVARFTRLRPVLIRNLSARGIALWFQEAPGAKGTLTSHIAPNAHANMGTYSGSVFCVLYQGDTGGCEAALDTLTLLPNEEYRYVFDDGSGEEAWREAYRQERAQCAEHKARTGREWLTDWSRNHAVPFPVHTVEHIGEEISVQTSSPPIPLDGRGGYEESPVKNGVLTLRALSTTPAAFEIRNFLSDEEADHLIELGGGKVKRSTIQSNQSKVRTSRNAWLPRKTSPITERISRRAADLLGVEEHIMLEDGTKGGHAESMQLVHYQPGQLYDAHFDWQASAVGTRFATVLIYLNSPPDGGWTAFPRADSPEPLLVQPVKGTAVLFYNMLPDGNADEYSVHAALPTRTGEKWLANLWVWDAPRL